MVMMKNPGGYYPPIFPGFPGNYPGQSQFPWQLPGRNADVPAAVYAALGPHIRHGIRNMPDSAVGKDGALWWQHDVKGYGVDMNRDGQYQKGTDGVLAFDSNHDGKLSKQEIEKKQSADESLRRQLRPRW